jgi:acyl CoA:acetate/3-ketoacid CoA transferase beta subunit
MIVTDLAVIDVTKKGLVLKEVAPGWTAKEIKKLTEPKLIVSPDLKEVEIM